MSRRAAAGAALAAAVLALSGCGVSGTNFQPGVAAQVGDERVYTAEVDAAADHWCDYLTDQSSGERFPKAQLRTQVLSVVVQRAAVEQVVSENDLDVPAVPTSEVQRILDEEFAGATERQVDGLRTLVEDAVEAQIGVTIFGSQVLQEEGAQVDPNQQEAAFQRGSEALSEWLGDHDIELNPVYGVAIDEDGRLVDDDGTSVVVSTEAGYAAQPDQEDPPTEDEQKDRQEYIDSLPASQTCG